MHSLSDSHLDRDWDCKLCKVAKIKFQFSLAAGSWKTVPEFTFFDWSFRLKKERKIREEKTRTYKITLHTILILPPMLSFPITVWRLCTLFPPRPPWDTKGSPFNSLLLLNSHCYNIFPNLTFLECWGSILTFYIFITFWLLLYSRYILPPEKSKPICFSSWWPFTRYLDIKTLMRNTAMMLAVFITEN